MYKVFFKDRIVFFLNDLSKAVKAHTGLFYRYGKRDELKALVNAFFWLDKIPRLYITHENSDFIWEEFKSCFRLIKAAGGVVTNPDGKIMVIKRHGLWDLPKGKMEAGESSEETALREVGEECSIEGLAAGKLITRTYHTYMLNDEPVLKETSWYAMTSDNGESPHPQLKEDITETVWFDRNDIAGIKENTYPSIIDVLETARIL
ncbi:MAG TPA: NUDIX domain-containing protein [Bacteroidales bacterium]|nr:NUDIX domain-containing protein [Bacteroidales bacterium]